MIITCIVLYLLLSEHYFIVGDYYKKGVSTPPLAGVPILSILIHVVILAMSIWYGGIALGIFFFGFHILAGTHYTCGWLIRIPHLFVDQRDFSKVAKNSYIITEFLLIITFIFTVVSFFIVPYKCFLNYVKEHTGFYVFSTICFVLGIVRITGEHIVKKRAAKNLRESSTSFEQYINKVERLKTKITIIANSESGITSTIHASLKNEIEGLYNNHEISLDDYNDLVFYLNDERSNYEVYRFLNRKKEIESTGKKLTPEESEELFNETWDSIHR